MAGISADDRDIVIGANVHRLRISENLTQRDLADALGVSTAQLQKYERGTNRLSAVSLYLLSRRLGVPVSVFFNGLHTGTDDAATTLDPDASHSQHAHIVEQLMQLTSELSPSSRQRLRGLLEDISALLR